MKKVFFIIIIFLFCLFIYGKYIEINFFKIKEYTIKNDEVPEEFKELKIVHFSDILYKSKSGTKELNKILKKINNLDADIIIFSGDLFFKDENYTEDDYNNILEFMKNINSTLFKFAVVGDNDYSFIDKYKDLLYESDFTLLDNENKLVFYKNNMPINIIGLSNLDNINNLIETDVECNYNLVIIHEPDNLKKLTEYGIDTIISGHSLGGIINVPFYGGMIKKDGAKTYLNDYYKYENTELFISNGIGYEKFQFRLFNSPSINVYRFD